MIKELGFYYVLLIFLVNMLGCSFKTQKSVTIANAIDNLPDKIKDGAYVIYLDQNSDIGTHWIDL